MPSSQEFAQNRCSSRRRGFYPFSFLDDFVETFVVVLRFAFELVVAFLLAVEDFFLVLEVFFGEAVARFFRVVALAVGVGGSILGRGKAGETTMMRVPSFTSKRGFPEDVLALRGASLKRTERGAPRLKRTTARSFCSPMAPPTIETSSPDFQASTPLPRLP